MERHRLAQFIALSVHPCSNGCSNFDFIEKHLSSTYPIQRFFSLMRTAGAKTLVHEKIGLEGLLQEEDEDLRSFGYWNAEFATRVSFWDKAFSEKDISNLEDANALGYLIVKECGVDAARAQMVTFEAVCNIMRFGQGIYPSPGIYSFKVGDKIFTIKGNMYCQQNGLTSKCSHVALRSLLSAAVVDRDFSVRKMNQIAGFVKPDDIQLGLGVCELRKIVEEAGLAYYDVYYGSVAKGKKLLYKPGRLPFHSFVYSGIETGCGSLLGFNVPAVSDSGLHLIPFFGHTFDRDMWAADAQSRYFHSKYKVPTYLSSEIWSDRFVGHDDNFGANITMPQYFISPNMLSYVMSIYRGGVKDTSGVFAEAEAVAWFYNSLSQSLPDDNPWVRRLKVAANIGAPRIVLRSMLIDRNAYLGHLRLIADSAGNHESEDAIREIESQVPEMSWMVELSIHQLFQANKRKLGEILFDARKLKAKDVREVRKIGIPFSVARVPDQYYRQATDEMVPDYDAISSGISSHVDCYRMPAALDFEGGEIK